MPIRNAMPFNSSAGGARRPAIGQSGHFAVVCFTMETSAKTTRKRRISGKATITALRHRAR
jgi:hypothetical protein